MSWIEAIILGLIQGLTEFLPVSSSGHLEIGKHLLGVESTDNLGFTVAVHGATVLSTLVVFRNDVGTLLKGLFKFSWNTETKYISALAVSMVPIAITGLFFKDHVEAVFNSGSILLIVGLMLLVTGGLLMIAYFRKSGNKEIGFKEAFIIGIAQTIAVMPGISRSGATIATGLLLGNRKNEIARFSFLMVLVPILGENLLSIVKSSTTTGVTDSVGFIPLLAGFVAAFIAGLVACKWMVELVKKGKLIWFAIYCCIIGAIAVTGNLMGF